MNNIRLASAFDRISAWSLYIFIFALPFSKSIVEITTVTALVSLLIKKALMREKVLNFERGVDIILAVFLAANLISLFNTPDMALSLRAFFSKSLKFAAVFLVTRETINSRVKLSNLMIMATISCVIIIIDGLTQHFITHIDFLHNYPSFNFVDSVPSFLGAPTASFPYPNGFAAWILVFIFPVGMFVIFGRWDWLKKMFFGSVLILLGYLLALTKTRGAWLAFIAALTASLIFKLNKAGLALLAVFLIFAFFADASFVNYITSSASMNDRTTMWKNSWEIFRQHPVIGNGLNTFFINYAKVRDDEDRNKRGSYAHNCYIQMAADIGLVGLLSFILFAGAVIARALRSLRKIGEDSFYWPLVFGTVLGLTAFLVHSAVDTNLYSLPLAALFWMTAGLLMSMIKIAEAK